jgi:hypothetical protein
MSPDKTPLAPEPLVADENLETAIMEFASIYNKCEIVPEIYS